MRQITQRSLEALNCGLAYVGQPLFDYNEPKKTQVACIMGKYVGLCIRRV